MRVECDKKKEDVFSIHPLLSVEINYFYSALKIDSNLQELSAQALYDYLVSKKKLNNNQIELVAFVIKEQGELEEIPEQQKDYFLKAWHLLERVDRESATFSMDRQMKLAELRGYLE